MIGATVNNPQLCVKAGLISPVRRFAGQVAIHSVRKMFHIVPGNTNSFRERFLSVSLSIAERRAADLGRNMTKGTPRNPWRPLAKIPSEISHPR